MNTKYIFPGTIRIIKIIVEDTPLLNGIKK